MRTSLRSLTAVPLLCAMLVLLLCAMTPTVARADGWWTRAGFAGEAVQSVVVDAGGTHVRVAGGSFVSTDRGVTWRPAPMPVASTGATAWRVAGGRAARDTGGATTADPASPDLGAAGMITAPLALDGAVVAVDSSSVVWRRGRDGAWARSLLLLPQGGFNGPPTVTALASFTAKPVSSAVYLGTAGFSVLVSQDGGDTWNRFGAGLPDDVTGLATDDAQNDVYAATSSGLFVHHLAALPAPPHYADAQYWWRVAGMVGVTLAATGAGTVALGMRLRRLPG